MSSESLQVLNHLDLYRLPWNYADNGISWLEPTTDCNLRCQGCYRDLENPEHKSLNEMRIELELFKRQRKSDCMSIAGGDPLVYPHIVELVAMVREMGWKPIINTNGLALDEAMLQRLKQAGVHGFTFHIDTSQNRPRAKRKSETQLNEVRQHFAEMLARAGGLTCSFNATITDHTLTEVPNLLDWAQQHADIVHTMVFILFRAPNILGEFDYFAAGRRVDLDATYTETTWGGKRDVNTREIVEWIRKADPLYRPGAYLNGTASPDSFKWLLASRIVSGGKTLGYLPPRIMELVQTLAHYHTGRYLAYPAAKSAASGKLLVFASALINRDMGRILLRLFKHAVSRPQALFRKAHLQSITIIQPVNFEADGRQDMCDGCPDMTVHEGKLVWSCRLEELKKFGAFAEAVPSKRLPVTVTTEQADVTG
ncbi:MAG: radical SAM protein [Gammaproteobacteria bacterium]|jgi:hypothetical protein|nr:radical SAM protein [Gammaproteobacteria bacterium]